MRYLLVLSLLSLTPLAWATENTARKTCGSQHSALVVSLQGKLYYTEDNNPSGHWQEAHTNDTLCEGSRVKVGEYSRVTLQLANGIFTKFDQNSLFILKEISANNPNWLELLTGFLHTISRTPKRLTVKTPIANAGPEGTEFAMSVDESKAALWVYEGGVKFFNNKGDIRLKPGESAQAWLGQAPQARIDIKPQDAVNWALYYPPVLPYPTKDQMIDSPLRAAINQFRQGHTTEALTHMDAIPKSQQSLYYLKVRAAMRETVGLVKLAENDIGTLLQQNPNDAEALALQSILALTQNCKGEAYTLASKAVAANANSAAAYSALSYAEQGRFNLDKAQAAADQAAKLAPHDAMVWARKAELELAQGLSSESADSAQQAIQQDAELERTQTVLGFSYLNKMATNDALAAFTKAIQLDSTSPLARLGLGLARIRDGNLAEGRQDLEIAAILDPNNSLIRSYLGKAYYEERRSALANDEFALAKERDPKDPTPYFYDSINKQTTNRPVEALQDMQKAIELNDNRTVYRSSLMLDKDAAARTANLARIYNDLGFGRVALKEAWKSINYDFANPTTHRFLSDAYIGQPRYRAARASELLQAQLLQPINVTPVQPQLTNENIGILNSTGPGNLAVNEYDPLFNANGAHIVLNGAYGSRNTKTDNAIISGIYNNFSGSLGQFHYQTDGFRKNDGYQQDIYNAFAQYAFTSDFSAQIELKSEDVRAGDVPFRLNGTHQEKFDQTIEQDTARVGAHLKIKENQDLLASYSYSTKKDHTNLKSEDEIGGELATDITFLGTNTTSHQVETQYLFRSNFYQITAGMGYLNQEGRLKNKINRTDILGEESILRDENRADNTDFYNGYLYLKNHFFSKATTIIGLSFDTYENSFFDKQQISPKFGIILNPKSNLALRAAVFRALKRPLASNQTVEPTQVAGFNQFFDEFNGSTGWQYGLGIDFQPINNIFIGGEVTWKKIIEPVFKYDSNLEKTTVSFQNRDIDSHMAYLYWVISEWISFKSEYRYDRFNNDINKTENDSTNPMQLVTQQIPISINFFHPSGFFAKVAGIFVDQKMVEVGDNIENERFWTFDSSLGYRFPKKYGVVSLEIHNLFDNHFRFQSAFDASGPQVSPFIPERQFFVKLNLFY